MKKTVELRCPMCGITFIRKASRQIYCSKLCYRDAANERERIKRGTPYIKCMCCGLKVMRTSTNQKYCLKCADFMKGARERQWNEQRKAQRHADKGIASTKTGVLDQILDEARERGISYAERQQEMTWEKIRRGEL